MRKVFFVMLGVIAVSSIAYSNQSPPSVPQTSAEPALLPLQSVPVVTFMPPVPPIPESLPALPTTPPAPTQQPPTIIYMTTNCSCGANANAPVGPRLHNSYQVHSQNLSPNSAACDTGCGASKPLCRVSNPESVFSIFGKRTGTGVFNSCKAFVSKNCDTVGKNCLNLVCATSDCGNANSPQCGPRIRNSYRKYDCKKVMHGWPCDTGCDTAAPSPIMSSKPVSGGHMVSSNAGCQPAPSAFGPTIRNSAATPGCASGGCNSGGCNGFAGKNNCGIGGGYGGSTRNPCPVMGFALPFGHGWTCPRMYDSYANH